MRCNYASKINFKVPTANFKAKDDIVSTDNKKAPQPLRMTKADKRLYSSLLELLKSGEKISVAILSEKAGVSQRAIYYKLSNSYLNLTHLGVCNSNTYLHHAKKNDLSESRNPSNKGLKGVKNG